VRRHEAWARRLRPIPLLAAVGVVLGGCVCCGPQHYGDDGRRPGFGRTAASESELIRAHVPRGSQGWAPLQPRAETGTQERLRQHWIEQAQRPR
jgi:hypothetical protein